MGQKVNPISNRLGIIKGWDSNWFGGNDYSEKIVTVFSTTSEFDQRDAASLKFIRKLNGKYMGSILNNVV